MNWIEIMGTRQSQMLIQQDPSGKQEFNRRAFLEQNSDSNMMKGRIDNKEEIIGSSFDSFGIEICQFKPS